MDIHVTIYFAFDRYSYPCPPSPSTTPTVGHPGTALTRWTRLYKLGCIRTKVRPDDYSFVSRLSLLPNIPQLQSPTQQQQQSNSKHSAATSSASRDEIECEGVGMRMRWFDAATRRTVASRRRRRRIGERTSSRLSSFSTLYCQSPPHRGLLATRTTDRPPTITLTTTTNGNTLWRCRSIVCRRRTRWYVQRYGR